MSGKLVVEGFDATPDEILEATKYIPIGGRDVRWKLLRDVSQGLTFLLGELLLADDRLRKAIRYGPVRVQANILTELSRPEGERLNGYVMVSERDLEMLDRTPWTTNAAIEAYQRKQRRGK